MGDSFLLTNNPHLVKAGERLQENVSINNKEIKRFLISTDFTPKSGIKRSYTPMDLCDTDIKCSQNKIGEIINLAQMLNSVYWDKKSKGEPEEDLFELYKDISNLNILSCIEIDRAKKISPVDAQKELNKIRVKHNLGKGEISRNGVKKEVNVRPHFFKYLDGGKDYKFKKFNCGMDYLNEILDKKIVRNNRCNSTETPLYKILKPCEVIKGENKTINKIRKYYNEMVTKINYIYANDYPNKYDEIMFIRNEALGKISKLNINENIIYTIVKRIGLSETNKKYCDYKHMGIKLMKLLFLWNKDLILNCFNFKQKNNRFIIEDLLSNSIELYGVLFKKVEKVGGH